MNTCLPCHNREGMTFRFDGEQDNLDVHIAAGMVCASCHRHYDVHGDERFRPSMRHPKVVRTNCQGCHVEGVVPVIDGKLDWVFLNRTEKGWEPVPNEAAPMVQYAAYGSPLTAKQFQKLVEKVEPKN